MIIVVLLLFVMLLTDLLCYVGLTPHSGAPLRGSVAAPHVGRVAYFVAYLLGVARLPYAIFPYVGKVALCGVLRERFASCWQSYPVQALRVVGDLIQLGIGYLLTEVGASTLPFPVFFLLHIAWGAEAIRLITEKGSSVVSAVWQVLPHQSIARFLWGRVRGKRKSQWVAVRRYIAYYKRNDHERLRYLHRCLKHYAEQTPTLAYPVAYLNGFRIVPESHALRGGNVRDIAHGLVFIHRRWTNDPWLLMGLALRRSPWIFDSRHLPRPFAYRSQANPIMTLMVLNHAAVSPPFAWYQWGHQIKAARFELFYIVGAWLRLWKEPPVTVDGTAQYDPLMEWLYHRGKTFCTSQRQWTDDAVILDMIRRETPPLSDMEIAHYYGYPFIYVQEILHPLVRQCIVSSDKKPDYSYK